MGSRFKTDFLFANPSFASGAARLLDFGGTFDRYNQSASPKEADTNAAIVDWCIVGDDIQEAIDQFDATETVK